MSKKVTLKIDGKVVHVPKGTNLIDAAEAAGIHIPNLCYLKGMRGIGACRMCLVEVEDMKAPLIGCTTKVKDGMVVNTKTEKVEEIRRFVIDLILSMHPLDCMTCTKAGDCSLQQYAYDFGIKESSFSRKKFGYPVDEENPFIKRDPDYCIICGRCVRVCKEQGTNVLEFMGRGVGARVVTAMDRPLQKSDCTFCGSCIDACPVNALLETDRWRKGREWEYRKNKSACLSCGCGCNIIASEKNGAIVKINAGADDGSAEKYICAIGRFGFNAAASDARVTAPMKRVNGELQETTWKDALGIAAERLKEAGADAGVISTAGILNQDALALSRFASDVIGTGNVDTTASLYSDTDCMNLSDTVDLDNTDAIILAGLDPSQWLRALPALDAGIRKRVSRGAKLIVINSAETGIAPAAAVSIRADEATTLAHIAGGLIDKGKTAGEELKAAVSGLAVTEDIEKAAAILAGAESPAIFCAPSLFNASRNLSLLIDIKIVAVPYEANARGVAAAGLAAEGKTYTEMISGGVDVLYAVGEVPVAKRPGAKFIIAQTSYLTDLAKQADIVLPAATYLESKGTIINYMGRIRDIRKIIDPAGNSRQHRDIIVNLSKTIGTPLKDSAAKIKSGREAGEPAFNPFEKKQGLDINPVDIMESLNKFALNHSKLLWLKEAETAGV